MASGNKAAGAAAGTAGTVFMTDNVDIVDISMGSSISFLILSTVMKPPVSSYKVKEKT